MIRTLMALAAALLTAAAVQAGELDSEFKSKAKVDVGKEVRLTMATATDRPHASELDRESPTQAGRRWGYGRGWGWGGWRGGWGWGLGWRGGWGGWRPGWGYGVGWRGGWGYGGWGLGFYSWPRYSYAYYPVAYYPAYVSYYYPAYTTYYSWGSPGWNCW